MRSGFARWPERPVKDRAPAADSPFGMDAVHSIDELLGSMESLRASDLHLAAGSPPLVRVRGELNAARRTSRRSTGRGHAGSSSTGSSRPSSRSGSRSSAQIDLSYSISGVARFRVNVFFQRSAVGAAFRLIPYKILTLEELAAPDQPARDGRAPSRPRPGHRADRVGQVDDARRADRRDQPQPGGSHPDDRGPDRVPPPAPPLPRQPARDRHRRAAASPRRFAPVSARTPT